MTRTFTSGNWTIHILRPEQDPTLVPEHVAVRIDGHNLTGRPDQLAELGRRIYHELGKVTLPANTWQILAVGDAITGLEFYGPFPETDPDGRAFARIRTLEIDERPYVQADLKPLADLTPIDPDPTPAAATADVELPGVGRVESPATYLIAITNGAPAGAYTLADHEMIEAYDFNEDGMPDWSTGGICDPFRGDADFFHPARALLRYLQSDDGPEPPPGQDTARAEIEAAFTTYRTAQLITAWHPDDSSSGYRISVWQQDGTTKELLMRTSEQARAFADGIQVAIDAYRFTR